MAILFRVLAINKFLRKAFQELFIDRRIKPLKTKHFYSIPATNVIHSMVYKELCYEYDSRLISFR